MCEIEQSKALICQIDDVATSLTYNNAMKPPGRRQKKKSDFFFNQSD